MVLVTTRDISVAKLMGATEVYDLKILSNEDCLQVFVQHANCDRPPNFDFDELLQKKIVTKCSGLPLAAKTLGGILRCNRTEDWEEILNDKLWSISDGSDTMGCWRHIFQIRSMINRVAYVLQRLVIQLTFLVNTMG